MEIEQREPDVFYPFRGNKFALTGRDVRADELIRNPTQAGTFGGPVRPRDNVFTVASSFEFSLVSSGTLRNAERRLKETAKAEPTLMRTRVSDRWINLSLSLCPSLWFSLRARFRVNFPLGRKTVRRTERKAQNKYNETE